MSAFGGQQRVYDDRGGSRWVQADVDPVNHSAELMKAETELEIHRSAFVDDATFKADPEGAGADAVDERNDNDELLEEQSQVTGWDGRALPDSEIAERNRVGDRQDGWDRPLEMADNEQLHEQNEALHGQNEALQGALDTMLTGGAPSEIVRVWNAEMAAAHQRLENTGMIDPAARQRMIDNHRRTQIDNQAQIGRERYGDEFAERYESLKRDAAQSPQHAQYLKSILFNGTLADGVMRYGLPRAQTRQQPPSRARSMQDEMDAAGGVSSADDERFIQDVWKD